MNQINVHPCSPFQGLNCWVTIASTGVRIKYYPYSLKFHQHSLFSKRNVTFKNITKECVGLSWGIGLHKGEPFERSFFLWTSCQKNAPRIFDMSCINKFLWNIASCIMCIARILKVAFLLGKSVYLLLGKIVCEHSTHVDRHIPISQLSKGVIRSNKW